MWLLLIGPRRWFKVAQLLIMPVKAMAPSYKYERGEGKNRDTPQVASSSSSLVLAYRLVEFRLKVVVIGSPKLLRSLGMSSSLVLLCNSRSFVIDLTYSYRYLHDLYPEMSDIYFMGNISGANQPLCANRANFNHTFTINCPHVDWVITLQSLDQHPRGMGDWVILQLTAHTWIG